MAARGLPYFAFGTVIKGFGRGSKDLGIPTANYPPEVVNLLPHDIDTGVYFGWASVDNGPVYKMVMSVGWNPFFRNTQKSMETHILHKYPSDFYGCQLKVCMLGYIRKEADFKSLEDLIQTIKNDISIAEKELDKSEFSEYKTNNFFEAVSLGKGDCSHGNKR